MQNSGLASLGRPVGGGGPPTWTSIAPAALCSAGAGGSVRGSWSRWVTSLTVVCQYSSLKHRGMALTQLVELAVDYGVTDDTLNALTGGYVLLVASIMLVDRMY